MVGGGCCGASRRSVLGLLAGAAAGGVLAPRPAEAFLDDLAAGLVSPEQEMKLGQQAFAQLKAKTPRSRNAALQRRLESVAAQIVPASGSTIPLRQWEVVVFQGAQLNAFALPGGKIGFFEGIFRVMENDAQVATVVGHEVGHVTARHAAQRIGTSQISGLGLSLAEILLGAKGVRGSREIAGMLGVGVQYGLLMPFSRSHELEADRLGLQYMAKAGFRPDEAVAFWRRMQAASRGAKPPAFLSTHPSDDKRIAELQAALPEARALYERRAGG